MDGSQEVAADRKEILHGAVHREDVGARDGVHPLRSRRRDNARERGQPLLFVLLVAEPSLVTGMDLACGLREGGHGPLLLSAFGEGVATRASDPTQSSRFLAGVSQWNEGDAAEPEVASLTLDDRSQNPGLGTTGGDHSTTTHCAASSSR